MTTPFIPKQAGDIILAEDWNEIQIRTIDQHRAHQHDGKDGSVQLGSKAIIAGAINGSHIDASSSMRIKSLRSSEMYTDKLTGNPVLTLIGPVNLIRNETNAGSGSLSVADNVTVGGSLSSNGLGVTGRLITSGGDGTFIGNANGLTVSRANGASGNLSVEGSIYASGNYSGSGSIVTTGAIRSEMSLRVGDNLVINNDGTSTTLTNQLGRLHITGAELLFLLNKSGVIVGKAWGGNGNLTVEGDLQVNGSTNINNPVVSNNSYTARGLVEMQSLTNFGTVRNNVPGASVRGFFAATGSRSGALAIIPGDGLNPIVYGPNRLHVYSEEILYLLSKSGVVIGKEWGGTGNLSVQGTINGTVVGNSDLRLKDNVQRLTGALNKVKALRGVSFSWKQDGKPTTGMIAQEVEQVIPEIVQSNDEGFKGINYSAVIPFLIEAIKEQQGQIDQLRAQLAAFGLNVASGSAGMTTAAAPEQG